MRLHQFLGASALIVGFSALSTDSPSLVVSITPQRAVNDGAMWRWKLKDGTHVSPWRLPNEYDSTVISGEVLVEAIPLSHSPCKAPTSTQTVTVAGSTYFAIEYLGQACK